MNTRRDLLRLALAASAAPAWIRHARAADVPRFPLGVASGCPRPDGLVLWTRLMGDDLPPQVEVQWELAEDEAFTRITTRGRETALADDAHSVHAEPSGLAPGRWYWYRFTALGQRSAVGRTRTAPAAEAMAPLDFAIASCQRYDHGHYAAWRHMADEGLDLVLFLGDYLYETGSAPGRVRSHQGGEALTLDDYRARYAQYKSDPDLQRMHAAAPWVMVWDDHEVDNDHAAGQSQDLDPPAAFAARRAAAYRAYWEHLPFPAALRPREASMRIHERYDWGRLARLHTLDNRQYRDPQACPRPGRGGSNTLADADCPQRRDPRRSLLGAAQEQWLAEGWSPEHRWNLLAQQTLVTRFSWRDPAGPGGGLYWTDGWDGYPAARERLLRTVAERGLQNVVTFGGDVHSHYVAELKLDFDDPKAPVIASEFCGTSISSLGLDPARIAAALPFNPHVLHGAGERRGYQRFRLEAPRLAATLRDVHDALDPSSPIATSAGFVVEHGRPGPQRA